MAQLATLNEFESMRKIGISIDAEEYENVEALPISEQSLMHKAIAARENAYAPYSKFQVGAAVLLEGAILVTGNNQENAAYPSGMCAERVAIWKATSSHPKKKIIAIAISATSKLTEVSKPVGPCGACRQTLSEYEVRQKEPFSLLFMGAKGPVIKVFSIKSLLPFSFDASYL